MLVCGNTIRFSSGELQELRKLTGPCYFEPHSVKELNQLSEAAKAYWSSQGFGTLAEAVGKIQMH